MRLRVRRLLPPLALAAAALSAQAGEAPDPLTAPIETPYAETWLRPQQPLRIHGHTYYVGFGGLSVVLIDTGAGLILIDAALPQSAPALEANIRQLGFAVGDIRYILSSEPHFDHAGGLAALVRDSRATVVASPIAAQALRSGHVGGADPQAGEIADFPAVSRVREIGDGQTLRLGRTTVTAHSTPGHTPGSSSWSWRSCENGRCLDVVFGASLSAVAADGYRFSDAAHAQAVDDLRNSIAGISHLPCDILISAHPDHSGFDAKLEKRSADPSGNPFIGPQACRDYAAGAQRKLDARLARERSAP